MTEEQIAEWRKEHAQSGRRGEATIAFAAAHGLTEFDMTSSGRILFWIKRGQTLHEFTARVKQTANRIGRPPDTVHGEGTKHGVGEDANLSARWEISGDLEVHVDNDQGKCELDPRSSFRPYQVNYGKSRNLHPRCKTVLDSLTDLVVEPATASEEGGA